MSKRQIDDMIFVWKGPEEEFDNLKKDFDSAHRNIKFDWGKLCKEVVFLDLNICFTSTWNDYLFVKTSVFCKAGNAFCYIQPESFHPPHICRGWIKTLLIRNITRSNTLDSWRTENLMLFRKLRARGYSQKFLLNLFDQIYWEDRSFFLHHRREKEKNVHTNRAVLSTSFVPGFNILRNVENLSFESFRSTTLTRNIFPPNGSWVAKAPEKLGHVLATRKAKHFY